MNILGIETSCDETAAAVVKDGVNMRSNAIYSQIAKHRPYGGVVPDALLGIMLRSYLVLLKMHYPKPLWDTKISMRLV